MTKIKITSLYFALLFLFAGCTKPPLVEEIIGKFFCQDSAVLGDAIELKGDNTCIVFHGNNGQEKHSYSLNGNCITFDNGMEARFR